MGESDGAADSVLTDAVTLLDSRASGNVAATPIVSGRYRLLRLLGRGGQGQVWHAFDLKLRVEVALKAIRPELIRESRARELLRREVRIARQVVSSNVCRIFDLIIEHGHEMVSMEFIDGTTLAELLRERGALDFDRAGEIAAQLLAGLEAIHSAGLIHGDVKPENIMLTLSRRVVLMDFGIARNFGETAGAVIGGTPGYMSPEQAAGLPLDARSDVFSAAIVLAEMVSPEAHDSPGRRTFCELLRQDPARAPSGPWGAVLRRALAHSPEGRYSSAGALARALELEQQQARRDDESPYPGLLFFSERNARFFFGRELEVELLLRRLRRPRLRAIIGPSGAGKSSLVRAGLVPALPTGWSAVVCTPTDAPFGALMRALITRTTEGPRAAPPAEDPSTLVLLARAWRERHEHALLIVDQAEELFTLSTVDVQARFAAVLARLVLEADVHVLLSMRDDFLLHCQLHEDLHPVFSELLPLTAPAGEALRRALVQPALLSGYRFEDERLVDDIIKEVARERGTLPLMAFAMVRLWDHREREKGLLTRRAYEKIGGVGGALAQHAEAVLEAIGPTRVPIVREIMRHLVTGEGTRAVQGWDELLSVFDDQRQAAEEVLSRLVEARLLTSFKGAGEEVNTGHQVEIIHESLLAAWPRLVRWRDQDAEGAHLRDQLRQAARVWDERGRPPDLLWTGQSLVEYHLWKDRYSGRLTTLEKEFGTSMETAARRRRFRVRAGTGAAFAALLLVLVVITQLWLRSRDAEREAILQARRAEAQQLFALGQVEQGSNPTLAFAYALAALEREDDADVRRFALRQMWKGPLAFVRSERGADGTSSAAGTASLAYSSDGEWLADSGSALRLWRRMGKEPLEVRHSFPGNVSARFTSDGSRLLIFGRTRPGSTGVDVRGLPGLNEIERIEIPGGVLALRGDRLITIAPRAPSPPTVVVRSLGQGGEQVLGTLSGAVRRIAIDPTGERYLLSYTGKPHVLTSTLMAGTPAERVLLRTSAPVADFWLADDGKRVAVLDETRALHIASTEEPENFTRLAGPELRPGETIHEVTFDRGGRRLAAAVERQGVRLWDLTGPPDAEPVTLGRGAVTATTAAIFDPTGRWLATEDLGGVMFWPTASRWPSVLRVAVDQPRDVAFEPNGKWIAASSRKGGVEIWPTTPDGPPRQVLAAGMQTGSVAISPDGQLVAAGTFGGVVLSSPSAERPTRLQGFSAFVWTVAFDRSGTRIAAAGAMQGRRGEVAAVFDLRTGAMKVLDAGEGAEKIGSVAFLPDGALLVASLSGLRRFDIESGMFDRLLDESVPVGLPSPDGRHALLLRSDNLNVPSGSAAVYDLQQRRVWPLTRHGDQVSLMAWDPTGRRVVTGSRDGIVRVGPMTDEEPHLLIGHEAPIWGVRVDSTGRSVASASEDGTVRIWPMPDGQPLHTWPHELLLDKLRSLTNVRVIPDASVASGYRASFEPFQGWYLDPPTW